jgi:hypothetical protein
MQAQQTAITIGALELIRPGCTKLDPYVEALIS